MLDNVFLRIFQYPEPEERPYRREINLKPNLLHNMSNGTMIPWVEMVDNC